MFATVEAVRSAVPSWPAFRRAGDSMRFTCWRVRVQRSRADARERHATSGLRWSLWLSGQEAMAVDDRCGEVDELDSSLRSVGIVLLVLGLVVMAVPGLTDPASACASASTGERE
jgi:hypothetical protein